MRPPDDEAPYPTCELPGPSMEGRSRDRPMAASTARYFANLTNLQWRGGHVTARWGNAVATATAPNPPFNGGAVT